MTPAPDRIDEAVEIAVAREELFRTMVERRNHRDDPAAVKLFEELEEDVAAHLGEPVVVVTHSVMYREYPSDEMPRGAYIGKTVRVGILNGPELLLQGHCDWTFPTESCVEVAQGFPPEVLARPLGTDPDWTHLNPLEGSLNIGVHNFDRAALQTWPTGRELPKRLEIAVGWNESDRLAEQSGCDRAQYEEALAMLGRAPIGPQAEQS